MEKFTLKDGTTFTYQVDRDTFLIAHSLECIYREIYKGWLRGISEERAYEMAYESHREAMRLAKDNKDTMLAVYMYGKVKEIIEEVYGQDERTH